MDVDAEDESDSDLEEDDDIEESAIEKTRRAVRDALGVAGSVTDTVCYTFVHVKRFYSSINLKIISICRNPSIWMISTKRKVVS